MKLTVAPKFSPSLGVAVELYLKICSSYIVKGSLGAGMPFSFAWVRSSDILLTVSVVGVQGPSEVEVSDICEGRKMNVAHGLAWSFYLGYLRLVLPRQ